MVLHDICAGAGLEEYLWTVVALQNRTGKRRRRLGWRDRAPLDRDFESSRAFLFAVGQGANALAGCYTKFEDGSIPAAIRCPSLFTGGRSLSI